MKKIILVSTFAIALVLSGIGTASARTPVGECSGTGLIFTIDDSKINDSGSNAYDDGLEVYCRNGIARFCLSNEACPWRSDITSADNMVCSPSGINRNSDNARNYIGGFPNMFKMAELKNKNDAFSGWRNSTEYWCSSDGKNKDVYPPYDTYEVPPTNPPQSESLYVSCDADDSYVETDERVRWTARASGGTGSYQYDWSGSEGLSGSGSTVTIEYDRDGTKTATVRVTSGSKTTSASCGSVRVEDDNDRDRDYDDYYSRPVVSCYPSVYYTTTDGRIEWQAIADGGNGRYSYSWSGTDSLSGNNDSVTKRYTRTGSKYASVTVRSAGRSTTATCGSVNINPSYNTSYIPIPTYPSGMTASCSASALSPRVGSPITWTVYPAGGNGVYSYVWSGSDGFSGSQKSVVTSYRSTGPKYATVSIYSAGKTSTISCGTINISAKSAVTAKPVIKKPIIKPDAPIVTATPDTSDFNVYGDVPWMFVMIIIIAVLFVTVMYLLISKKG